MATFEDIGTIHDRLEDLAQALELEESPPVDLLVCGGAALAVLGLISRATEDIDILAIVVDETDVAAKPLSASLRAAITRVARLRGISEDWINPGPSDMQSFGLPVGIIGRAHRRDYGPLLVVRFLDRYDQIHLKLYATVDSAGKHLRDLRLLGPTQKELSAAAAWCITQDPSKGFRMMLVQFLNAEGFADVAVNLPESS